jgi:DNA-binding transcriptional MerR regulator
MSPQVMTMRIGELSRRVGVSTHVLRAWESRYGLLRPVRSSGGYRLYGPADERRVRAVLLLREAGSSAAEACRSVLRSERSRPTTLQDGEAASPLGPADVRATVSSMLACVRAFDDQGLHVHLDRLLAGLDLEEVIRSALMPLLVDLGEQWADGTITVAHEHFASNLLRQRLAAMTLSWGSGAGPLAVLACPPGERHDIPLLCLGLLLGRRGWRVRFLGADTPRARPGGGLQAPAAAGPGPVPRPPRLSCEARWVTWPTIRTAPASSSAAEGRPRRSPSRPEPSCCLGTSSRPPTPSIRSWPHLAERTLMPFDAGRFGLALLVSALAVVVLVAVTAWWSHRAGKVAVVDVVWGLFFAAIGCSLLVVNPGARALLLAVLATVWGVRLATHLWARARGHEEDFRYAAMLASVPPEHRFAYAVKRFFVTQGVIAWIIAMPLTVAAATNRPVGVVAWLGVAVWAIGLGFEALGDAQLRRFKADPGQQGQDHGPWTLVLDTAPQLLR